jgi:hypothetical protein
MVMTVHNVSSILTPIHTKNILVLNKIGESCLIYSPLQHSESFTIQFENIYTLVTIFFLYAVKPAH